MLAVSDSWEMLPSGDAPRVTTLRAQRKSVERRPVNWGCSVRPIVVSELVLMRLPLSRRDGPVEILDQPIGPCPRKR